MCDKVKSIRFFKRGQCIWAIAVKVKDAIAQVVAHKCINVPRRESIVITRPFSRFKDKKGRVTPDRLDGSLQDKQFRSLDINLDEVRGIPIGQVIIKAFCVDDDRFLAHGTGIGPFA
jgi:hypothetical protein